MPRFLIPINSERMAALKNYIETQIEAANSNLQQRTERYNEIDALLRADRIITPSDTETINHVTPVTQMRVDTIAARMYEAIFSLSPIARISPVTGVDSQTQTDWHSVSREATDWFDYAARRPNRLDVEAVTRKNLFDFARYGLCARKVIYWEDRVKSGILQSTGDWSPDPTVRVVYQGPRWFYISPRNLLWPDGYGDDVQVLPWVAIRYPRSLSYLTMMAANKDYDPAIVDKIKSSPSNTNQQTPDDTMPTHLPVTGYNIDEIWCKFDIDNDGIEEDLIVDRHVETGELLRCVFNSYRQRPIYVSRLRYRASTSFDSLGIPDILRPVQKQIDELHNLALTAGKVAAKSVRLIRFGSTLARTMADENIEITPDFEAVTENPQQDMTVIPLGNPAPAMEAIQLVDYNMKYAQELVGVGPAAGGDVGMTRRAPAYGVQAVLQEGSTFTRDANRTFSVAFIESILMTFEIMRVNNPQTAASYQILGDDGLYIEKLLNLPDSLIDTWSVGITISDPDNTPESAVQRNMILGQFLLGWLQQLGLVVQNVCSPQVPDSAKVGISNLAIMSEKIVSRIVELSRDMQDLSSLMPHLSSMLPQLIQLADQEAQQQAAAMAQQTANVMRVAGPHAALGLEQPKQA